jgi:hypothetical protein
MLFTLSHGSCTRLYTKKNQAGGNVGTTIINELLKDGTRFNITAITRETSSYTAPTDKNVTHRTVDYTSASSFEKVFRGQDAIVNCVTGSATTYEPSKLIIDSAIAAGVKFFFANEFVGYVTSEQYRRLPEANVGAKYRIREYLVSLGEAGKIAWTSLNGGPFFDMWLMKGPAGFDIGNRHARIYGTGTNRLFWTPLPTIGFAAGNMLRNPDAVLNRPIYITPFPKLTQNMLLYTLESVLEAKFSVEHIDIQKINQNAKIVLERGGEDMGKALKGYAVSNQFCEGDSGNDFGHLVENETVGVAEMSVEEAVREAVERYGRECEVVEGMFRVEACEI